MKKIIIFASLFVFALTFSAQPALAFNHNYDHPLLRLLKHSIQRMIDDSLVPVWEAINGGGTSPGTPDWSLPTDDKWYTGLDSNGFTIQTLPNHETPLNSCNYQGSFIPSNQIFAKAKVELPSGQTLYGAGTCEKLELSVPSGVTLPSGANLTVEVEYLWWNTTNTKTFDFLVQ